jgi:hypothetical protein
VVKNTLLVLVALGFAITVHAQQTMTVGELLSKGGKKLTKQEVTSIYASGVKISGLSPSGARKFELTYFKDGTLSGQSTDTYGQDGRGLIGTWSINDEGKLCAQIRNAATGRDATPNPPCGFRFKSNDMLYSVRSEEPDALAQPLTIIK